MKKMLFSIIVMSVCGPLLFANATPEIERIVPLDKIAEYGLETSSDLDIRVLEHTDRLSIYPRGRDVILAEVQVRDILALQELSSDDIPGNINLANKGLNRFDTIRFSYEGETIDALVLLNIDVVAREESMAGNPVYGRIRFDAAEMGDPITLKISLRSIQKILDEKLYNISDETVSEQEQESRMDARTRNLNLPIEDRIFYLVPHGNPKKVYIDEIDRHGKSIVDGNRLGNWFPVGVKTGDYNVALKVYDEEFLHFIIQSLPVDDAMHVGR